MAALGLFYYMWTFSSCGEQGPILCCDARASHWWLFLCNTDSRCVGFSSCGARAQMIHGMWNLPGPGIEPVSLALSGTFLTTVPLGKSLHTFNLLFFN